MQVGTFKVTHLAYTSRINPDGKLEVRVMHRSSGKPLAGVQVLAEKKVWENNRQQTIRLGQGPSDKQGRILFDKPQQRGQLAITLLAAGDTLLDQDIYVSGGPVAAG